MNKTQLGPVNALYPSLTTIVGATVNGKPNWITIAHVGIMNHSKRSLISVALHKNHHTNQGIHEHKTFSVNLPSQEMLVVTDYVGIVSGKTTDKSELFETFYGELETAPMIVDCPVSMECRLERVVDFDTHDLFVGEIVQTHAIPTALDGDKIDYGKVEPLLFDFQRIKYWSIGEEIGDPWRAGKVMKTSK